MQPFGENMAAMINQAQGADQDTSDPTNTTPVESIPGTSTAPSSSLSTLYAALVPFARVQNLEAQMATLVHHIKP